MTTTNTAGTETVRALESEIDEREARLEAAYEGFVEAYNDMVAQTRRLGRLHGEMTATKARLLEYVEAFREVPPTSSD